MLIHINVLAHVQYADVPKNPHYYATHTAFGTVVVAVKQGGVIGIPAARPIKCVQALVPNLS